MTPNKHLEKNVVSLSMRRSSSQLALRHNLDIIVLNSRTSHFSLAKSTFALNLSLWLVEP